MTSDVHTGPLAPAPENAELHAGPLAPSTHPAKQKAKKTWREQRWERRRRRRVGEEILAWILVPVILLGGFWAVKASLAAFGTTPTGLIENIRTAVSGRS
jgi:hypothetical protein